MRVQILKTVASWNWCFNEGTFAELPDPLANKLINEGFASACPESNAIQPQRNAAKPKPQFKRG